MPGLLHLVETIPTQLACLLEGFRLIDTTRLLRKAFERTDCLGRLVEALERTGQRREGLAVHRHLAEGAIEVAPGAPGILNVIETDLPDLEQQARSFMRDYNARPPSLSSVLRASTSSGTPLGSSGG